MRTNGTRIATPDGDGVAAIGVADGGVVDVEGADARVRHPCTPRPPHWAFPWQAAALTTGRHLQARGRRDIMLSAPPPPPPPRRRQCRGGF